MSIELFVDQDGTISGPYSPSDLKRMVREGEICKDDMIRKGIDGKPVRAENVKGFFSPTTELAKLKPRAELTPALEDTEPEPSGLSKTWDGLRVAVTAAVSKLRTQPTSVTTANPSQFITRVEVGEITQRKPEYISSTTERPSDVSSCPFCGEEIKAIAKKCRHCGEILDVVMRAQSQPVYHAQPAFHAPPVINIVNTNTAHAGAGGRGSARWSPLVAVLLSLFIPGLGQLYKGQFLNSIVWFVAVIGGYIALVVPGVILHFCCLIGAASGDPYR